MAERKKRLELTWIGKEERPRLEPRILLENADLSYHAATRVTDGDIFDNYLIHGDNLLALKALEQDFGSKVRFIYIDPPYNTGNAFERYDDGVEHSIWLTLMRDRIRILANLLAENGFFCCQIDDGEGAYLKVLLDEIFGRANYLSTMFVQVRYANKTLAEDSDFQKVVETILVYAKDATKARPNKDRDAYPLHKFEWEIQHGNPKDEFEAGGRRVQVFGPGAFEIRRVAPSHTALKETWATGSLLRQKGSSGEFFQLHLAPRKSYDGLGCLYKVAGIGEDGLGYRYFTGPQRESATKGKFYSGIPLQTLEQIKAGAGSKPRPISNFHDFAAQFGNCRHEGGVEFRGGKKPEALISWLIRHFSDPGDTVLDSFAGSGTTAAVAHKLRRRWITIELGNHAMELCVPRLQKVIDGKDAAGVTEEADWKGGGGFRFFKLASSLLGKDKWGNWIVSKNYRPEMLAEAMCKLEGFQYSPDSDVFWVHGKSTERDFIYVTTQNLTHEQLQFISYQVGTERTLLICCSAFRAKKEDFPNLTLKKIPQAVLNHCEWGRDDYSLNVEELAPVQVIEEANVGDTIGDANGSEKKLVGGRRRKISAMQELPLFDGLKN